MTEKQKKKKKKKKKRRRKKRASRLSFFLVLVLSLSLSLSLSRLFQEIFITFFRYRSRTQLYSFAETRVSSFEIHFDSMTPGLIRAGKRRKGQQHDKKTVSCANISSFVRTIIPFIIFRRHSRYVPRTLLLRMKNKRS